MHLKIILSGLFLISVLSYCFTQESDTVVNYNTEIENYRKGRNIKMVYTEGSPLPVDERKNFEGLNYFAINEKYHLEASLVKAEEQQTVVMKTSTDREPEYIQYGEIVFTLDGEDYKLLVYQSKKLLDVQKEVDHVFVPFRDGTSGKESYGGGRYVDCKLPTEGNTVLVDFNKAYNPYCAYNPKYSCVIPPEENRLSIRIEAGEKTYKEH